MANDPVVLTPTLANDAMTFDHKSTMTLNALQAVHDGRTVCMPVRTEAEAREAFVNTCGNEPEHVWVWLAALRYAGAIK